MKRIVPLGFLACLSLAASACSTSLAVQPLPEIGNPHPVAAPAGLVYFLPYVELEVELSRRLEKCSWTQEALILRWLQGEVENLDALEDAVVQGLEEATTLEGATSTVVAEALKHAREARLPDLERELVRVAGASGAAPTVNELHEVATEESSKSGRPDFEVEVAQVARVDAHYLPDTDHGYSISFASLANGLKKTELKVAKHPNGMLKSFNAKVDDRTGDVVQAVLRGGLSLASAAGGVPLPPVAVAEAGGKARDPMSLQEFLEVDRKELLESHLCTPETVRLLARRKELEERARGTLIELAAREADLAGTEKNLTGAKGKLAEARKALEGLQGDDSADAQKKRAELEKTIKDLQDSKVKPAEAKVLELQKEIKRLTELDKGVVKALRETLRELTITRSQRFNPGSVPQVPIEGAGAAAERWFEPALLEEFCRHEEEPCSSSAPGEPAYPKALLSYAAVHRPAGGSFATTRHEAEAGGHLVYREPVQAELLICKEEPCLDCDHSVQVLGEDVVASRLTEVPQLGALATLPLTNGSFENNTLAAEFTSTGSLVSLEYTTTARAKAAAETFEGSAEELSGFIRARREADKAKLERQTAEVEAEAARLEALLELEKAREELEAYRRGERDTPAPDGEDGGEEPAPGDGS